MRAINIILFVLILIGIGLMVSQNRWVPVLVEYILEHDVVEDYRDGSYRVEGYLVTLVDGESDVPIVPDGSSRILTRYFGNELRKDIDGDGREDVVFFLTQERGGSGVFFYIAAALARDGGYIGVDATVVGDRIAPQSITSGPGRQVWANYADRAPGEPMTARPSVGRTLRLLLDTETRQFGEVVADFEGESNIPGAYKGR